VAIRDDIAEKAVVRGVMRDNISGNIEIFVGRRTSQRPTEYHRRRTRPGRERYLWREAYRFRLLLSTSNQTGYSRYKHAFAMRDLKKGDKFTSGFYVLQFRCTTSYSQNQGAVYSSLLPEV
jgi:hypothetical protein